MGVRRSLNKDDFCTQKNKDDLFGDRTIMALLASMDEQRWEDLEMDCLVKVLEKVGMESLLLDVPFVCKSWYKATLNPSCWQSLIFPDNECMEVWPWDVSECPNFQNLMDRFASEYQIDGDCFSKVCDQSEQRKRYCAQASQTLHSRSL
ncbi:unnamed protein product [Prunus brigantina]